MSGKIFAKNVTKAQREWLNRYLNETTFEPMWQGELTDGTMTFEQVAKANLDWFETWMHDAYNAVSRDIPS